MWSLRTSLLRHTFTTSLKRQNSLAYSRFCSHVIKRTDVEDYIQQKRGPYTLIDVRNPDEFSLGLIPTAKTLPLPELEQALSLSEEDWEEKYNFKKIQPEDNIIFYCRSGRRSESACEIARQKGFKQVKNYQGSFLEWFNQDK